MPVIMLRCVLSNVSGGGVDGIYHRVWDTFFLKFISVDKEHTVEGSTNIRNFTSLLLTGNYVFVILLLV